MFDWRDYGNGIHAFDAGYVRPILAAIHMIVDGGRVAFIDTGSNDSLPNVLAALDRVGLDRAAVDHVILTHIHLDHAGGAGTLMREFPNARLVVHPRGSRHMAEPAKLVAGVTAVYGQEYVDKVYGDILPIAFRAHRRRPRRADAPTRHPRVAADRYSWPRQASHLHRRPQKRRIFTGDMFGLSYREFDVDGRQFILPTTTPTQFDPAEMHASIERLMSYQSTAMYLTHYAQLTDVTARAADLHRRIDHLVAIAEAHADAGESATTRSSGIRPITCWPNCVPMAARCRKPRSSTCWPPTWS